MLQASAQEKEKQLNLWAYIFSAVVLVLVGWLHVSPKFDFGVDFSFLPPLHSGLNVITAILLLAALYFIKNKNVKMHRNMIYAAMTTSAMFLISYSLYHATTEVTKFGGTGSIRMVYFFILITHVILAAAILPFVLLTFTRAFTGQFERHKKMARWVFPLWLYVAITGPICYLMLKPYY